MFKFKSLQKKPLTSLRARLSNATAAARFRNDEAGIAAIEFAFIAWIRASSAAHQALLWRA